MKIKLIALAPFDGWAFIIKDEALYLVRPPYHVDDLLEATDKELAAAVGRFHFRECNVPFDGIAGVVRYLRKTYVEEMEKMGFALPDHEDLKGLLEFATKEVLVNYLDKMETEFIPNRNLDGAEALALELLRLEIIKQDTVLFNRTLEIINKCRQERQLLTQLVEIDIELAQKYPNAEKKYTGASISEVMKGIWKRHQLLSIGA